MAQPGPERPRYGIRDRAIIGSLLLMRASVRKELSRLKLVRRDAEPFETLMVRSGQGRKNRAHPDRQTSLLQWITVYLRNGAAASAV